MPWQGDPQRIRRRPLRRRALRRAALRYAEHGWHIAPGAYLIGIRFDCNQPGCYTVSCHPTLSHWEAVAGRDPHLIRGWWRELHHSVLLATGRTVDVLEVPAALGRFAAAAVRGPVAVAPSGRLLFLMRPGQGLLPDLQERLDVILHGLGSWVPVPPTDHPGGRMRWETAPEESDWELPDPYAVQSLLLAGVRERDGERAEPARRVPSGAPGRTA